ncbi:hypothetical protein F5B18DRAFT_670090 [Nemania serpens]|nr:hypothetical protein F5B18DRAFT_670090 [Nemania serpens]
MPYVLPCRPTISSLLEMDEALLSILCSEVRWFYDAAGRHIRFNKDGTGELWCRCNFHYWTAVDLEWKSIGDPRTSQPAQHDHCPQRLGELELEIILIKRLPQRLKPQSSPYTLINKFADEAFQPKSYIVMIERGNFREPCSVGYASSDMPRFALRLVFDKSP